MYLTSTQPCLSQGDVGREMFFINKGTVEVLTENFIHITDISFCSPFLCPISPHPILKFGGCHIVCCLTTVGGYPCAPSGRGTSLEKLLSSLTSHARHISGQRPSATCLSSLKTTLMRSSLMLFLLTPVILRANLDPFRKITHRQTCTCSLSLSFHAKPHACVLTF